VTVAASRNAKDFERDDHRSIGRRDDGASRRSDGGPTDVIALMNVIAHFDLRLDRRGAKFVAAKIFFIDVPPASHAFAFDESPPTAAAPRQILSLIFRLFELEIVVLENFHKLLFKKFSQLFF
jgi:hypothetical protein